MIEAEDFTEIGRGLNPVLKQSREEVSVLCKLGAEMFTRWPKEIRTDSKLAISAI